MTPDQAKAPPDRERLAQELTDAEWNWRANGVVPPPNLLAQAAAALRLSPATAGEWRPTYWLRDLNIRRQVEWDQGKEFTLLYYSNAMAGEVGEACNVVKKLERLRMGVVGSRATVQDLSDELADVVIYADLAALAAGIDLFGEAIPKKFNATSEKYGLSVKYESLPPSPKEAGR